MIIANPIYDVVFKRLMEDNRSARFFIGTLLDEMVIDVVVAPQEISLQIADKEQERATTLALLRMDFVATIKTSDGSYKRVLIEIQKSRRFIDIARFRTYLGSQYQKRDELVTENGLKVTLPIITIYILGFSLPEIPSPAIKVARHYTDLISKTVIDRKSDFIEQLTHDCYVVQITRVEGKVQTRLERLLSIFEQKYFVTEDYFGAKDYHYEIDDDELHNLINVLGYVVADKETRKQIEAEQEALRVMDAASEQANARAELFSRKVTELEQGMAEMGKAISEKDRVLSEKERALSEKERLIEEQQLAYQQLLAELERLKNNSGG
ncbi:MAG: hypothetical protein EBZ77_07345 [Chitinophagia bacterium]|nr:hypothetical protein [Chitinophagia bacterium]